ETYVIYFFSPVHGDNTKLSIPIRQDADFLSADVGDNVTLKCFYEDSFTTTLYWYKQVIGQKPKLMSSFYLFGQKASFTDEFRNSTRFQLVTENLQHHLTISDLRVADSATYYCLAMHQLASVYTPTCDEEHAVYWFRNSGESLPGVIFTSAVRRNNKCDRKTNSCFFNLSLKNMNESQTGTYYCGVASCQSIVFGAVTKIREFKMITLLLLLVHCEGRLDTMQKKNVQFKKNKFNQIQKYADGSVLWKKKMNREHTWTECVYFSVKQ
uniref:Ig-like domain-containing protein n=1 Tax=Takifugu rubripes TaxID=31033 RepID=A0A3B5KCL2_TAKRU